MSKDPEEYDAVPIIPLEDDLLHTDDNPFCTTAPADAMKTPS